MVKRVKLRKSTMCGWRHRDNNEFKLSEQRLREEGMLVVHGLWIPASGALERVMKDHWNPYPYSWDKHLFPHDPTLRRQSCELLRNRRTADEFFVHSILQTVEECFTREDASNVHSSLLWAGDKAHAIHEHAYQVIVGDVIVLSGRLTAQRSHDFLDARAAWRCVLL
jgi:hypothetical protein